MGYNKRTKPKTLNYEIEEKEYKIPDYTAASIQSNSTGRKSLNFKTKQIGISNNISNTSSAKMGIQLLILLTQLNVNKRIAEKFPI